MPIFITLGNYAFSVAASRAWNGLLASVSALENCNVLVHIPAATEDLRPTCIDSMSVNFTYSGTPSLEFY